MCVFCQCESRLGVGCRLLAVGCWLLANSIRHAELVSASVRGKGAAMYIKTRGEILKQIIRLRSSKTSLYFLYEVWPG